jgi:hypothetical protein
MSDLIEWRHVRHEGISFTVALYADDYNTPFDVECYSAEDIAAWCKDQWAYVGVVLTTTMSQASVWGVEYGKLSGTDIGFDDIIEFHARDLLAEAYGI